MRGRLGWGCYAVLGNGRVSLKVIVARAVERGRGGPKRTSGALLWVEIASPKTSIWGMD